MPRATNQVASRRRRKKVLKATRGNYGARRRLYRTAKETLQKGLAYAYRDRRNKKREFRRLWIVRINAAARVLGLSYNRFIQGLKQAGVSLDRKTLASLAVSHPQTFAQLAELAKKKMVSK